MNILVLNINANSGKTTIAKNLLLPWLPLKYVAIESICDNADIYKTDVRIHPEDYLYLQDMLLVEQNILVDIGSSRIEQFFYYLKMSAGEINDFDYLIVPLTADTKSSIETQKTLVTLLELGAKMNKIRLIFNKGESDNGAELLHEFNEAIHIADNFNIARPTVCIKNYPVFSQLRNHHLELQQVLQADDDSPPNLQAFKQAALAANDNLDQVFNDLNLI